MCGLLRDRPLIRKGGFFSGLSRLDDRVGAPVELIGCFLCDIVGVCGRAEGIALKFVTRSGEVAGCAGGRQRGLFSSHSFGF